MPGGQPTKYKPEYCQQLISHMTEGFSFESFGGRIGSHRDTLYEWAKVHPEFSDAKKLATDASQYYWERQGKNSLWDKEKFNSSVYIFTMKARFKWADQIVIKDEKEEEREKLKKLPLSELLKLVRENLPEEIHEDSKE